MIITDLLHFLLPNSAFFESGSRRSIWHFRSYYDDFGERSDYSKRTFALHIIATEKISFCRWEILDTYSNALIQSSAKNGSRLPQSATYLNCLWKNQPLKNPLNSFLKTRIGQSKRIIICSKFLKYFTLSHQQGRGVAIYLQLMVNSEDKNF